MSLWVSPVEQKITTTETLKKRSGDQEQCGVEQDQSQSCCVFCLTMRLRPRKACRNPLLPLPLSPKTLQRKTLRWVCFFCRSIFLSLVTEDAGQQRDVFQNRRRLKSTAIVRDDEQRSPVIPAACDSCSATMEKPR